MTEDIKQFLEEYREWYEANVTGAHTESTIGGSSPPPPPPPTDG